MGNFAFQQQVQFLYIVVWMFVELAVGIKTISSIKYQLW